MELAVEDAGSALLRLAEETRERLIVVAPFIKRHALERILVRVADRADVVVITRWHLLEILSGVSDLAVWPLVRDRGGTLLLEPRLHAKVYANEHSVLTGSANVTGSALGWHPYPNCEVVVRPHPIDEPLVRGFTDRLLNDAQVVDDELYERFVREIGDELPTSLMLPELVEGEHGRSWLPASRDPVDVERLYRGEHGSLTSSARLAADRDLLALETPIGLTEGQLRSHIALQLHQIPFVGLLRSRLSERRRFGEVAGFVAEHFDVDRSEAASSWQTLMRWLVHFQPNDWEYGKPRHSEILVYVGPTKSR